MLSSQADEWNFLLAAMEEKLDQFQEEVRLGQEKQLLRSGRKFVVLHTSCKFSRSFAARADLVVSSGIIS